MVHKEIVRILKEEEGFRSEAYIDTEGYPTIGYGLKIGDKGQPVEHFKLFKMSKGVGLTYLEEEVVELYERLSETFKWFTGLSKDRQVVIACMAYQLGVAGLYMFKNMIVAILKEDWNEASVQMLDSRWFKQTPNRVERMATMMKCVEC